MSIRIPFRVRNTLVLAGALLLTLAAGQSEAAQRRWTGLGDGVTWTVPANWEGAALPGAADDVLLDHAFVPGSFSVLLPGGVTTVSVHRLSILPGGGLAITLTLPSSNTANPGLKAGDTQAGTDDIVLGAGATVINASGASFGNGIEANSVADGSVRIENGARYVHKTLRSTSGIVQLLSTAPGTELGVFEYDVPGTAAYNISASGRSYGSLTLTRTAGSATYGALGASEWRVNGNLRVASGVSLNSTMTGPFRLGGNLVNDGVQLILPPAQAVVFDGSGVQVVSGSAGLTINGPGTVQSGSTLALGSQLCFVNGSLLVNGRLRIDLAIGPRGVGVISYGPGIGELEFNSPTTPIQVNALDHNYWPTVNGPAAVYVRRGGMTTELPRSIPELLSVTGPVSGAQLLTIAGTLDLGTGASLNASPIYAPGATLRYGANATPGPEWVAGSTVGPGVPQHVFVDAGTGMVILPPAGRTVPGDFTLASGTLAYDPAAGGMSIQGAVRLESALWTYGRPLTLNGNGLQTLVAPVALASVPLRIAKTAGSVRLQGDVRAHAGLIYDGGAGDVLELDGYTLTLAGQILGSNPLGGLWGSAGSGLDIDAGGVVTPVRFLPGGSQLRRLSINSPSTSAALTLASDVAITDSLVLAQGRLATGPFTLSMGPGAVIDRASGWVAGRLSRGLDVGQGNPGSFPIGDALSYAPVTLVFSGVTTPGVVTVSTSPGDHSSLAQGSGIDGAHSINRTWQMSGAGLGFASYAVTLEYTAADMDPGSDPTRFGIARFDSAAWFISTPMAHTATSTSASGLTGFGSLAVGTVPSFSLGVSSGIHGSVAVDPVAPTYLLGTTVRLVATPDPGYHLAQWSGDASGNASPLDVIMTSSKSIAATFTINTYSLTVAVAGAGSVSRQPDLGVYAFGDSVTLTAIAAAAYHFVAWGGDASGSGNPLIVLVDTTKTISAVFELNTYSLQSLVAGNGSVIRVPDLTSYPHGTVVTLTATGDPGYHFVGWSGDTTSVSNPLALVMTSDRSLTVTFAVDTRTLTINTVGGGVVLREPDQTAYPLGSSVQLTAVPDPGQVFLGWSGDATGTTSPLDLMMNGNKSVTASFTLNQPPAQLTFTPTHDTRVTSATPTATAGSVTELRVRSTGPTYYTFLEFNVVGIAGGVVSAKLRLFCVNDSPDGGEVHPVSNNYLGTSTPWVENALNWNNAPAISGTPVAKTGAVTLNAWVEFDVTAAIVGNDTYSFGMTSGSTNTVGYSSKEGTNPPQLVIVSGSNPVPVVNSFSPQAGPAGTQVTLNGLRFTGASGVAFNGLAASSFVVDSDVQLRAFVPTGGTTGPLTVTNAAGPGTSSTAFTVIVPPSIAGFTPGGGPVGTQVTINGSGFTGTATVTFNGLTATFIIDSDTQLRATVPATATTGVIAVTNAAATTSSATSFTVTAAPAAVTFTAVHDARVVSSSPTTSYGAVTELRVRSATASPAYRTYLKFDVPALAGPVQSAKVRLYCNNASTDGGAIYAVSNNYLNTNTPWLESGLTWNNAPTLGATPLSQVGAVAINTWFEFDVTSAVTGMGTYSLGMLSTSSDIAGYSSKETAFAPQLVVTINTVAAAASQAVAAADAPTTVVDDGIGRVALGPTYPNPFRDLLVFRLDLPRQEHVRLEVLDVTGRRMRMLVDDALEPGSHAFSWDGRDNLGVRVEPGIYMIHLEAPGFTARRKAVMVR